MPRYVLKSKKVSIEYQTHGFINCCGYIILYGVVLQISDGYDGWGSFSYRTDSDKLLLKYNTEKTWKEFYEYITKEDELFFNNYTKKPRYGRIVLSDSPSSSYFTKWFAHYNNLPSTGGYTPNPTHGGLTCIEMWWIDLTDPVQKSHTDYKHYVG